MDFQALIEYVTQSLAISEEARWLVQIFVIIFFTLLLSLFLSRILRKLENKLKKTKSSWDNIAVDVARKPLSVLIWVIGLGFAGDVLYRETQTELFSAFVTARDVAIIVILAWWILRFINKFEQHYVRSKNAVGRNVDVTTVNAIAKLAKAAAIISAFLIILQELGFSIEGILAFGGVGGIAVGFAARDLLANFFGAMTVYMDKPFRVGDWIRSPDKEIEGTVEEIGWRMTTIRTFDKRPLYVPNSTFTSVAIENPSRMSHRRIYETIGIRYEDIEQMGSITEHVMQMLINHPEIDESQTMIVNFDKFNNSSVDFFVYTFTHTTRWVKFHEIKHDVLLKISKIITDHGAEIAFPTRTLHVGGVIGQAVSTNENP
jgi:MscS family membrane protein